MIHLAIHLDNRICGRRRERERETHLSPAERQGWIQVALAPGSSVGSFLKTLLSSWCRPLNQPLPATLLWIEKAISRHCSPSKRQKLMSPPPTPTSISPASPRGQLSTPCASLPRVPTCTLLINKPPRTPPRTLCSVSHFGSISDYITGCVRCSITWRSVQPRMDML
ncbi:hypothetical protein Q8A73_011676 [Channa argus]|nr:hypothetical protein Q8A73_011676 [Channa argus]